MVRGQSFSPTSGWAGLDHLAEIRQGGIAGWMLILPPLSTAGEPGQSV